MDNKDRLDRIESKLDKIADRLHETNLILTENTTSLIIHEKRTDIAERKLNLLELEFKEYATKAHIIRDEIQAKLTPILDHVNVVHVTLKYVLPSVAAVIAFLFKIGVFK